MDVTQRAYEIFESSEDAEKRQFLQYMLQNSVLKGRKLEMTLQTTFQQILGYTSRQAWLLLKDLFINRRIEFDCDLESLKILYKNLNLDTRFANS